MAASWSFEFNAFKQLEDNLKRLPNESEKVLNKVIHEDGVIYTNDAVRERINISEWKGRVRNKKHAKNEKLPLSTTKFNLGFRSRPKPKIDYIKFPDQGIGTSKNNPPQEILSRGMNDEAAPKIIQKSNEELINKVNQTIGGK